MNPTLTMDDLMQAKRFLSQPAEVSRPVYVGSGEIAFEIPVSAICGAIVGGLIAWDDATCSLWLTPRAEHMLRAAGAIR